MYWPTIWLGYVLSRPFSQQVPGLSNQCMFGLANGLSGRFISRYSAAGASGIRAEIYKALATNPKTFSTIRRITHDFWTEEKQPEQFNYGRLGILPKKGDLSAPGNHRGTMMLEVGQKIISNIMRIRLAPLVEELDHGSQCGFRPKRGTGDAIFTLKMALKKRK